jgi:hypothetical protein
MNGQNGKNVRTGEVYAKGTMEEPTGYRSSLVFTKMVCLRTCSEGKEEPIVVVQNRKVA